MILVFATNKRCAAKGSLHPKGIYTCDLGFMNFAIQAGKMSITYQLNSVITPANARSINSLGFRVQGSDFVVCMIG